MPNEVSAQELKSEGQRLFYEGLYEEAAAAFERARALFAAAGNEGEAAEMVNNLGLVHHSQGKWDEAIAALEQARATFVRLGDRSREAQVLANMSRPYAAKGEPEKARECLQQAADIFAALGDEQRRGEVLLEMSRQMWKSGARSEAVATFEAGLQTLQKPSISQKALRSLLNLRNRLLTRKSR
ncbi:MAG: tetratricopeptide repeat protein [Anaerolineae bacterium]|nr:tetratricopeptide repeat protein [Anaerolineae bacterium]